MVSSMIRILTHSNNLYTHCARFIHKAAAIEGLKYVHDQIDYVKSMTEHDVPNWTQFKNDILSKRGNINQKNIEGILLKILINDKKFNVALSFAEHLKESNKELSLGSINGLLGLYYELGKENKLSDKERLFILETFKQLYDKYKVLDYTTSERLLHALCAINDYTKAFKVINDICLSATPSHSAYSTLIATLFKNNKKTEAFNLINESLNNKRPLLENAYEEWINYIQRNYKSSKTIQKYLDEICLQISRNCTTISSASAELIGKTYKSIGWNMQFTEIKKDSGQCSSCKEHLQCLKLTDEEFNKLQQNIKQKLIVGSDLFLKTSPDELKRFLNFTEKNVPYDIVLDALNIAYGVGKGSNLDRLDLLKEVVDYFLKQNKKILLLGRQHMLNWHKRKMDYLLSKTHCFFTDNLTQDDPYFITAAILSGPNTDFVSKDLLRGHRFLLKDEQLRHFFQRWQWQHQWMVFINKHRKPHIQAPLIFTPCAQRNSNGWHLPYEKEDSSSIGRLNDGTPDLSSWICLKSNVR